MKGCSDTVRAGHPRTPGREIRAAGLLPEEVIRLEVVRTVQHRAPVMRRHKVAGVDGIAHRVPAMNAVAFATYQNVVVHDDVVRLPIAAPIGAREIDAVIQIVRAVEHKTIARDRDRAAATASMSNALFYFWAFFAGTAVYFVPFALLGPFTRMEAFRQIVRVCLFLAGLWLVLEGILMSLPKS